LGVIEPGRRDTHRVLVVSHSCDISSPEKTEPFVEVVVGELLVKADKDVKLHNGHSIRLLDLSAPTDNGEEWTKFRIATKRLVPKAQLLRCAPWPARNYPASQRRVLSRWLAQRYNRSAFPDMFNNWLKDRFGRDLEDLIKTYSTELVAVYFDLDNGEDNERTDPRDPYELSIDLVYDTSDAGYAKVAETAAGRVKKLFDERCQENRQWRWIELISCEHVADTAFTLRAANETCRWRLEHHSVSDEPLDESE